MDFHQLKQLIKNNLLKIMRIKTHYRNILLAYIVALLLFSLAAAGENHQNITIGGYKLPNPESASFDTIKKAIDEMQQIGISYAWMDVWGTPGNNNLQKVLNYADKAGFEIVVHLNTFMSPLREVNSEGKSIWKHPAPGSKKPFADFSGLYGLGEENWAQRWKDNSIVYEGNWKGHPYPFPDMWAPIARDAFRRTLREALEKLGKHPSVKFISYDDEYRYWLSFFEKKEGQSYFSPWSSKVVSALSNLENLKDQKPEAPGFVALGNDPVTALRYTIDPQFVQFSFMNESIKFHINDLSNVLHNSKQYDIKDFSTTGAMGTNSDIALARAYSVERNLSSLESAFAYDYAQDVSKGRQKMFVLMGWWNKTKNIDFYIKQIRKVSNLILLRGPDSIAYAPIQYMLSNPKMKQAIKKSINDIKKYGPMFKKLKFKRSRVGLLWSDNTVLSQQQNNKQRNKNRFKDSRSWKWLEQYAAVACLGYPALCQAGYIPEIITEKDVLEGKLDKIDVLIMLNYQYSESRLIRKYNSFVKRGGTILADKSSNIKIPQRILIDFDASMERKGYENGERNWWSKSDKVIINSYNKTMERINNLAGKLKLQLAAKTKTLFTKSNSNGIIVSTLSGCGAKYMVAINTNMFSDENTSIAFSHDGPVYSLNNHEKTIFYQDQKSKTLHHEISVSLKPDEICMWLLVERPMVRVNALVVHNNAPAVVRCQLWDDEGFPMTGVIPFEVKVSGKTYYSAAEHGIGYVWIPVNINKNESVSVSALGKKVIAKHML